MKWLRALVDRLMRRLGWARDEPRDGEDGKDIYPLW